MAQNSLAVLETYLKDIIYKEAEITAKIDMREHIFEIKDSSASLGFISLYDLKAYVFEHEEEAKSYYVKNIDSIEWKNIFEHPFFQRRKPQLVSTDSLKDADDLEFFILQKGQKVGPYEKYELVEMIEKREILLSDMISVNAGHTWIKLHQVDGFERRSLKESSQLPGMPDGHFLKKSSEAVNTIGETTDAITSLAYLGNIKRGKSLEREQYSSLEKEKEKEKNGRKNSTSIYKWLLYASIVGIIYFLINIKSNLSSPFSSNQASPVGEQAEMLTPVEMPSSIPNNNGAQNSRNNVFDQRRSGKFEQRRMPPPRPAARKSFMETTKFKDATASPGELPADEANYFYDNAAPMELDPVRAQISKENFDNGGEPGPAPEGDTLFNQEVSN
jgi:hypothetical protein